jgi:hypothetical protein
LLISLAAAGGEFASLSSQPELVSDQLTSGSGSMLLFLLRLLVGWLSPQGGDGLSLAARADGRVEQLPAERSLAEQWLGRNWRRAATRRGKAAPALRAKGKAASWTDPAP